MCFSTKYSFTVYVKKTKVVWGLGLFSMGGSPLGIIYLTSLGVYSVMAWRTEELAESYQVSNHYIVCHCSVGMCMQTNDVLCDRTNLNVCSFSFNLKPSTLSTFSMPNGRLFQLEIVAGKKEYLYESQFAWRCLNLKL